MWFFKIAKSRDEEEQTKFYKLVKYVKANQANLSDSIVRNFIVKDNLRPDLIDIPEEYDGLSIDDVTPSRYRRSSVKKKFIRNRNNKLLTGYDAWRSFDRSMFKTGGKHPAVAKFKVAPADLVKAFGMPCESTVFDTATGEYNFEDNNLDCFSLFDHKQTDLYHGLSREDEFYMTPKNMSRAPHVRKRKYPTVAEFWESTEPQTFKLTADDQSEWRKFKRWLLLEVKKAKERTESFEEMALRKHKDELDISLGDFDEKGVVNHE